MKRGAYTIATLVLTIQVKIIVKDCGDQSKRNKFNKLVFIILFFKILVSFYDGKNVSFYSYLCTIFSVSNWPE